MSDFSRPLFRIIFGTVDCAFEDERRAFYQAVDVRRA
jgi:hypothetical protein